jgi:hypothetical protein
VEIDIAKIGMEPLSKLNRQQRGVLAGYIHTEGFKLIQQMIEDEIKLFNQRLVNTDPTSSDEVLSRHRMVKAAGMIYQGLLQRIEEEITLLRNETSTIGTIEDPERPYYPPEFEGQEAF